MNDNIDEKWAKKYIKKVEYFHNTNRKLIELKKGLIWKSCKLKYIAIDYNMEDLFNIVFLNESMRVKLIIEDKSCFDVFDCIKEQTGLE
jgi:hypothetical protein